MIKPMECPYCKIAPHACSSHIWYGKRLLFLRICTYIVWGRCGKCNENAFRSLTRNGCYRKFNRWARRELRRMKKEGEKK